MKENMYQPMLAARHSLPWFAFLSLHLYEAQLLQTVRVFRSTAIETIYKRLAYLGGMFYAMLMKFNPLRQTMLWFLAKSWRTF